MRTNNTRVRLECLLLLATSCFSLVVHRPSVRCALPILSNQNNSDDNWNMFEDTSPIEETEDDLSSDSDLLDSAGEWDSRVPRFHNVHLTGRIGNMQEPKYLSDGKVVLNLSLACTRKYDSNERKHSNIKYGDEETDWYSLEMWGQTAEFASKFVDKGSRVGIVGTLQLDSWTDKETGEPKSRPKVVVREFDILETKAESELRRSTNRGPSFYSSDDTADAGSGGFFS